jgi:hypothetical protein
MQPHTRQPDTTGSGSGSGREVDLRSLCLSLIVHVFITTASHTVMGLLGSHQTTGHHARILWICPHTTPVSRGPPGVATVRLHVQPRTPSGPVSVDCASLRPTRRVMWRVGRHVTRHAGVCGVSSVVYYFSALAAPGAGRFGARSSCYRGRMAHAIDVVLADLRPLESGQWSTRTESRI